MIDLLTIQIQSYNFKIEFGHTFYLIWNWICNPSTIEPSTPKNIIEYPFLKISLSKNITRE